MGCAAQWHFRVLDRLAYTHHIIIIMFMEEHCCGRLRGLLTDVPQCSSKQITGNRSRGARKLWLGY
jgi:hypothetical protein